VDPVSEKKKTLKIALVGNPNSGKSTLFNALTGLRQKTGNFPGVTVDKKSALVNFVNDAAEERRLEIIDLPGTYSLYPKSIDELIAASIILEKANPDHPDAIVVVADSMNLKRSLFLITQLQETGTPLVIVLNMKDMAERSGIRIDAGKLSRYFHCPVIACNSRGDEGIAELKKNLASLQIPEGKLRKNVDFANHDEETQKEESIKRFDLINRLVAEIVSGGKKGVVNIVSEKLDSVFTHRIWGILAFLLVMFTVFQSIFYLSAWPMSWIESGFNSLGDQLRVSIPENDLSSLLVNGILPGLSGVAMFIPQIAILFFFISIMEDTGYMARISFIMDRLLKKFGMNGRSVIPLMSGIACAIPAIMGTRTISNWRERMITIMVTPFMSCSARLPVYTLMIALVIPNEVVGGIFNLQGLVLTSLYFLGFFTALAIAWVMKFLIKAKEKSYFIMELPVYRKPRWSSIGINILDKVKVFVLDAGKVILAISIILWYLASHGPEESFGKKDLNASEKLEASYAGHMGKWIEPAIAPLGFDWKIGIAIVTSFAAREVFVGTISTIYSVGDTGETEPLRKKLSEEKNGKGEPVFSFAMGVSLMLFFAFAMQCMSTFAVVKRETKSWKWPVIQFIFMGVMAWVSAFVAYQALS